VPRSTPSIQAANCSGLMGTVYRGGFEHLELKQVYVSVFESRGNGMGYVGLLVEPMDLGVGMIYVAYRSYWYSRELAFC
jgi:hypothetical protein